MGLDAAIRGALKAADAVTARLQTTVQHAAATIVNGVVTRDANGRPNHNAPIARQAVIDLTTRLMVRADGTTALAIATLTFPRPVTVTNEDVFTLPDGSTGKTIDISGPIDPSTGAAFATTVMLGAS